MTDDETLSPRMQSAIRLAVEAHGADVRKGSLIHTLTHLFNVCELVLLDGGSEDEATAALLHDTLEDHPETVTRDRLREAFGDQVLRLVEVCTDTPADYTGGEKPSWRARKEAYLAHVRTVPGELLRPTVADKVDNLRAIARDLSRIGPTFWERFGAPPEQQVWYYASAHEAYRAAEASGALCDAMSEALGGLRRALGASACERPRFAAGCGLCGESPPRRRVATRHDTNPAAEQFAAGWSGR